MINHKRINLNLSSHPLKNRKLFILLCFLLCMFFVVLSVLGGVVYFSYKGKARSIEATLTEMEQSRQQLESDVIKYSAGIQKATKERQASVELINSLILRKSFSWVDFLSYLEDSLPDSSYIISLAPTLTEGLQVKVRFEVISRNLDDLLKLLNSLKAFKFKDIRVLSEASNERGLLRSEIALTYERTL